MYGAKMKAIRNARGLTQGDMAKKIHVAQNTYCEMESTKEPRKHWEPELLQNLAEALGVSVEDITTPGSVTLNFHNGSNNVGHVEIETQTISMSKEILDLLQQQLATLQAQLTEKDRTIAELIKKIGK